MKLKQLLLLTPPLFMTGLAHAGTFKAFDARSAAMGGTGVASAQIVSAPFYNPAMLAAQHKEEDFALLFGGGINAQDDDNLFKHLSNFVDAVNAGDITATANEAALAGAARPASLQVNTFLVLGWSSETWAMAYASSNSRKASIDFIENGASSRLDLASIKTSETSISLARNFGDGDFSVGITPKSVEVSSSVVNVDANLNDNFTEIVDSLINADKSQGSDFNLDAGMVYHLSDEIKVGAVVQNIFSRSYTEGTQKFNLEPTIRAGAAFVADELTLAFDYDITTNAPVIAGGEKTQYMAAGAEFDLFDSIQLRAGYNKNMAVANSQPTISAGFGFNLLAMQLDLTAMKNNDATSFILQLGARF